ncbi:hypothetical protein [Streptomyces sp. DSM 15324]|uniref:hypothetical protein n=1 Tax=Streptomyces sp. DSM 15324 TaxID=1739111 RepID=UPI0007486DF5|nr:hypothetical protein [Streptomyces sp. DSM 15324]KUO09256.1 hypothetical protein AQJ58_24880 [Streptomyces sp. DSM 15324]
MAALAAVLLALAGTQSPAQAAESEWVSFDGGQARVLSAVYSVFIGGATYEVARGTDNNIWFRYNGGSWGPLGGYSSSRTTSPPRIVEFPPGRAMAVVRGLDGEIWYSQVNSGSANFWTAWTRLPTGARAIGSPLLTVSSATGDLMIEAPNANRLISYTFLRNYNGNLSSSGWTVDSHAVLGTNHVDIEGDSQIAVYGTEYYRSVYRSFFTGSDHHVWRQTVDPATGRTLSLAQVNGGAECTTGVGASRLGNQSTVVGPGQPGYASQQRVLISCIGNDGYVWVSTSSDGGLTFDGWRHPTGRLAPSASTPAVFSTPTSNSSWTLNVRWNAALSAAFADNSIVAKRIN